MNIHAQPGLEPTPWREEMAAARRPPVEGGGEGGERGEGGEEKERVRTERPTDRCSGEEDRNACAEFGAFVPAASKSKRL